MNKRRVMCCGTFDYLHPGHLSFIEQAAALGDELYVVVARDENVQRIKGHYPDHREEDRKAAIEQLRNKLSSERPFRHDVPRGYYLNVRI